MVEEECEEISVKVPKELLETLDELAQNNSEYIREEMLERLEWDDKEVFFGDLLRYGGEKASKDGPIEFLRWVREKRIPVFKEEEGFEETFEDSMYIR